MAVGAATPAAGSLEEAAAFPVEAGGIHRVTRHVGSPEEGRTQLREGIRQAPATLPAVTRTGEAMVDITAVVASTWVLAATADTRTVRIRTVAMLTTRDITLPRRLPVVPTINTAISSHTLRSNSMGRRSSTHRSSNIRHSSSTRRSSSIRRSSNIRRSTVDNPSSFRLAVF